MRSTVAGWIITAASHRKAARLSLVLAMSEGRKGFCDDWSCPAAVSCKWHFGRSHDYASMANPTRNDFWRGEREAGADSCRRYQFDQIKPWLVTSAAPLFVSPSLPHHPKG
jgi:hypothetical protein